MERIWRSVAGVAPTTIWVDWPAAANLGGLRAGARRELALFVGLVLAGWRSAPMVDSMTADFFSGASWTRSCLGGQLDVGGEAVGEEAGLVDEVWGRSRGWL